jgi:crossover junction endodeoxyribonuclease RuvC
VRILGIDPGSFHAGFGLIEQQGSSLRLIEHGCISCPRGDALGARLAHLVRELDLLLARTAPDAAALEATFHGRNTRSLIVLAQARGALLATLVERGLTPREYSPAEVKSAVTGNGRADKTQVQRMVRLLLALPNAPLATDASDALAIAICAAQRVRFDAGLARTRR